MIKKTALFIGFLLVSGLAVQAQSTAYDPAEAMKALEMFMGGAANANGETVQAIHFRQLKGVLPGEFEGMNRTSVEAGKNSAMGITIGYADAEYEKDGSRISVKIQDISSMSGFMRVAQFAWASQEMERESDEGYERTATIAGFPGREEYNNRRNSGQIDLIVDERFMIEVRGQRVDMDQLKRFVKALNPKQLTELEPEESE